MKPYQKKTFDLEQLRIYVCINKYIVRNKTWKLGVKILVN